MLETYNLMEEAMLDNPGMLDDDVMINVLKTGVAKFLSRIKFTVNILVPNFDMPLGVVETDAEAFFKGVDDEHFAICMEVLPPGSFISEKAQKKINDWLEITLVRKSFKINEQKCHVLKAEMYNDVFVCLTVEKLEGNAA